MVSTNYNESYGTLLQAQIMHIWYTFLVEDVFVYAPSGKDISWGFQLTDLKGIGLSLGQPNFGAIKIDWNASPVTVTMEVRDADGFLVLGVNTSLLELQAQSVEALYKIKPGEYRRHCSLEVTLPWVVRHRLAILFFCALASKLSWIQATSFLNAPFTQLPLFDNMF